VYLDKSSLDLEKRSVDSILDGVNNIRKKFGIDEELCACFIERQETFESVDWTKLMQILKENGIFWRETRLISKLYMDRIVEVPRR
jgi:hypothetical protein